MRRLFLLIAGAALFQIAIGAQSTTPSGPRTPEPFVARLDAIVSDRAGRPVSDLHAEDFEVLEEGKPRDITSVRFVTSGTLQGDTESEKPIQSDSDERAEARRDGARLFAFFLDEYHITEGPGVERARQAIADFVSRRLAPRDLAIVLKPLDSLSNLRLSRDRGAMLTTIANIEGRRGIYEPRNAQERNLIAFRPPRADAVRAQVVTSALNALAVHLGTLGAGRKTIVFVSEGFPRGSRRRVDEGLPSIDTVIRTANRSGVSIYPIDPRAFASDAVATADGSSADDAAMLQGLATETDGRAIVTASDLSGGVDRITSDASGYYVVAFKPAYAEGGRFHPVEVRITRRELTLRTRSGYWSPLREPTAVRTTPTYSLPPIPLTPHIGPPLIQAWFGQTRGANGKTRVQFVWEPMPKVPGDRSRLQEPAEVTLTVMAPDGTPTFEQAVNPPTHPGTDPKAEAVFEEPARRVRVRLAIADDNGKILATDIRDIVVAPLTGTVALGNALVLPSRNARELRAIDNNAEAVPVASRQFGRSERLLLRVPVYGPQPGLVLTARLASRLGQSMRELTVSEGPRPDLRDVDLPLAALPTGEYRVEFTLTNGTAKAQDTLTFRVTP